MFKKRKIVFQRQLDTSDCGSTCLCMIARHYGKAYSLEYMRELSFIGKEGVSLLNLSFAAEKIGFRTLRAKLTLEKLAEDCPLPCVLHWNQDHFIVLYEVYRTFPGRKLRFKIADPAHGVVTINEKTFRDNWISTTDDFGMALLMEPTTEFYQHQTVVQKPGLSFLVRYLAPHKRFIIQLFIGMLATSLIALAFPLLTQFLVDYGIQGHNIHLIYMLLLSQLFLFTGSLVIDLLQNWLLLHVNIRLNLNIISDFLIKLMRLPIKFFDSKAVGDILQRINDHQRIETFLTGVTLSTLFSFINIVVFSTILSFYSTQILFVFLFFSIAGVSWILLFQRKRKELDYERFSRNKENQDQLVEMITGMQEIKLYGSERTKRWNWEYLQIKVFRLNIRSLALAQYQRTGYVFLNQFKNILISFIAASAVLNGELSLGVLLSISFIIGQTNGPLEQLVAFIQAAQDAKISMDRMNEIHSREEEEKKGEITEDLSAVHLDEKGLFHPQEEDIILDNISFQYEGPHSPFVLKDICLRIPKGKITAIVGDSGSGKTTLMKLLLGYYEPVNGRILVGDQPLPSLSPKYWRSKCGTIMQDGYIFSDTIANNIALDGEEIDHTRMQLAVETANIKAFIESCPMGYVTRIGNNGTGISGGQRQRIFIARAVYKDPDYLFMDEATSSLDAINERKIMNNLQAFFGGKSVVIIAHRLSTVKNADQIIVLQQGRIVEQGDHQTLTQRRGYYYELVKNQLEIGN
ncbi:peptidase domain-containing ABC transporter [Chitinophaga sp. LS1]|uniref:peptidase domain-containing ABC transporter n=1 Tax=Chitinophaga sp. LS1 TaxID=3051176 RepID=UPI002AAB9378|nr:peptidase domain-containing ABC transporter [Chitinophaga sp. LS1]WPV65518.1 peptidase domain-containing ABC transporter [Chitinophaga sp. LS1]